MCNGGADLMDKFSKLGLRVEAHHITQSSHRLSRQVDDPHALLTGAGDSGRPAPMPSDFDTLGDLVCSPEVVTIVMEHQTCISHCYFVP